jgi:hypothetical protein
LNTSILDDLVTSIRMRRAILFVGAGISMSVGLPSWRDLIEHMCGELDIDPKEELAPGSSTYQTLAEYYRVKEGSVGPLRSWMDRHWSVSPDRVASSRLHELIVALDFPIIYTTNYDRNLEVAYEAQGKPFVKVANAKDVSKAIGDATQIIKFHGDFDDDRSLVIAESDYFDRLTFDSPLDVKLRADAMGRTMLFIGYSMSDLNIRLLLYKLWRTWKASGYERERPPSFVFMANPSRMQEAVLGQWGITVVTADGEDPEAALTRFLEDVLQRVQTS